MKNPLVLFLDMTWLQKQLRTIALPIFIITIFSTIDLHSQVFRFDRVIVSVKSEGLSIQRTLQKEALDSVFKITTQSIQEFETLLGFKLTETLELNITNEVADYQEQLQQHEIWKERFNENYSSDASNHYPIYMGTDYGKIRIQIRYCVAHFILNEFLNGNSVRQRITQSGFQHFPSWFFQGMCAHWAGGWTVESEDEFDYYENKSSFKNPNLIEPLSAQVFGRKVWKSIYQEYGKQAVSNLWFVLKYTGNLESATMFLTGERFIDWFNRTLPDQLLKDKATGSDLTLTKAVTHSPVIEAYPLNNSGDFLFKRFVPDKEILEVFMNGRTEVIYESSHGRLMGDLAFSAVGISPRSNNLGLDIFISKSKLIQHKFIDTLGNIAEKQFTGMWFNPPDFWGFAEENQGFKDSIIGKGIFRSDIFYSWGSIFFGNCFDRNLGNLESFQKFHSKPISRARSIDGTVFSIYQLSSFNDSAIFQFTKSVKGLVSVLRTDTFVENTRIRGLVIEASNRLSYLQSNNNRWYVYFLQLGDSIDFQWRMPLMGGFGQQIGLGKNGKIDKILELHFVKNKSIFRILDVGKITSSELKLLVKENPINELTIKNINIDSKLNISETDKDSASSSWEYLSIYPKRDTSLKKHYFHKKSQGYQTNGYYGIKKRNNYVIQRGGLYFSNEDPSVFPYLVGIMPDEIYNHPLTPELRFYVHNSQHTHQMRFGILGNLPMSRKALRFSQQFKMGKYVVSQEFFHRNRAYYQSEYVLKQNNANLFNLGISRTHARLFTFGIRYQFQNDIGFKKINRPFSSLPAVGIQITHGISAQVSFDLKGKNISDFKRYRLLSQGSFTSAHYNNNLGSKTMGYDLTWKTELTKSFFPWLKFMGLAQFSHSFGKVKQQYWIGGSLGSTWRDQWNYNLINPIENYDNYVYRKFTGSVRGFLSGERMGSSSAVINLELRVKPYTVFTKKNVKSELLQTLLIYSFYDIGTAFIGDGISDRKNPFNTEQFTTPNYTISVTAKRNPWIAGAGIGISANVLRVPIRYEMAWGFKDGKIGVPIKQVCMTWNF